MRFTVTRAVCLAALTGAFVATACHFSGTLPNGACGGGYAFCRSPAPPLPKLALSTFEIPLSYDLKSAADAATSEIPPSEWSSEFKDPVHITVDWSRGAFSLTTGGNRAEIVADFSYHINVWQQLIWPFNGITWLDCRGTFQAGVEILADWSYDENGDGRPDGPRLAASRIVRNLSGCPGHEGDIRTKVEAKIDGFLPKVQAKLDGIATSARDGIHLAWARLGDAQALANDSVFGPAVWLNSRPETLYATPFVGRGTAFDFSLGFGGRPIIEVGNKPAVVPPVWPGLDIRAPVGGHLDVEAELRISVKDLEVALTKALDPKAVADCPRPVSMRVARIRHVGPEWCLDIDVSMGPTWGTVALEGTQHYDKELRVLRFTDYRSVGVGLGAWVQEAVSRHAASSTNWSPTQAHLQMLHERFASHLSSIFDGLVLVRIEELDPILSVDTQLIYGDGGYAKAFARMKGTLERLDKPIQPFAPLPEPDKPPP